MVVRYSIILTIIFFIFFNVSKSQRNILFNRDDYEAEQQEVKEKIYQMSKQICPNHTDEIEEKMEEVKMCAERINENEMTMCQVIEKFLRSCTAPMVGLYEKCLPKKSKSLPAFVAETLLDITKFFCDNDGAHLLEIGNPCIMKKDHLETRRCVRQLKKEMVKYHSANLPVKDDICKFHKGFRSCFTSHVENSCKDNTTREAFTRLYDVIPCK